LFPSLRFGCLIVPIVISAGTPAPDSQAGLKDEITKKIGMKLAAIAPGKFLMGSTPEEIACVRGEGRNNGYDNEAPRHKVEVSKKFYIGVYPVTHGQYRRVVGTNPSWFSSSGGGRDEVAGNHLIAL
jgi:formylglycine-generating enzyme required for sulfatase activity